MWSSVGAPWQVRRPLAGSARTSLSLPLHGSGCCGLLGPLALLSARDGGLARHARLQVTCRSGAHALLAAAVAVELLLHSEGACLMIGPAASLATKPPPPPGRGHVCGRLPSCEVGGGPPRGELQRQIQVNSAKATSAMQDVSVSWHFVCTLLHLQSCSHSSSFPAA